MFSKHYPASFDVKARDTSLKRAKNTIARAATTKLEYKFVHNILNNNDLEDCLKKMHAAEVKYSKEFMLPWQDHVHPSVKLLRSALQKKFADKKAAEKDGRES